jgi:autotransporter passenger strand-loop-strand repeat protein
MANITFGNSPVDVNGFTLDDAHVFDGGVLSVTTLGTIIDTQVGSGGFVQVGGLGQINAFAGDTEVFSGGLQVVTHGGVASGTEVFPFTSSHPSTELVISGGQTSDTVVSGGRFLKGQQIVGPGGTSFDTLVTDGGLQSVSGGLANGTTIEGQSEQDVRAGGVANATNLLSGGQDVFSGGTANFTTVHSGGTQFVLSGGVANSTVLAGGAMTVEGGVAVSATVSAFGGMAVVEGGVASNTLVLANGKVDAFDGGTTVDTTLFGNPTAVANEFVNFDGLAVGTTVSNFGVQDVVFAGTASNTLVENGGTELVHSALGGVDPASLNPTILAGGQELVWDLGFTSGANVSGGLEVVEGPATGLVAGSAFATTVNGGDLIDFGFVSGTQVLNGTEVVWSAAVSDNETISGAGSFNFVVGSAFGDNIDGGTEFVVSGGFADGTTVNAGGVEVVSSGSTAQATTINLGGTELVASAGVDTDSTVAGTQIILAGGTADGADITAGGFELVSAGGTSDNALIDGGVLQVRSGGSVPVVSFSTDNGGSLVLDSSQTFTGLIAGFSSPPGVTEQIDLQDISFGAGTKVTFTQTSITSGTLTVTSGTETANLTLLGTYSTANFTLSSDGHGGTLVKDPAVTAAASLTTPQA